MEPLFIASQILEKILLTLDELRHLLQTSLKYSKNFTLMYRILILVQIHPYR
jgi:hypothetical protein